MEVVKGDLMANTQAILDEEVPVQPLDFGRKKRKCPKCFVCGGVWLAQLAAYNHALHYFTPQRNGSTTRRNCCTAAWFSEGR